MRELAKNSSLALFLLILTGILTMTQSANALESSTEIRPLAAEIETIETSGAVDLKIRQGISPGMIVHANKRQLTGISTEQEGRTLHIRAKSQRLFDWLRSKVSSDEPISIEITLPVLRKLVVQGAGSVSVSGYSGDQMQLEVLGSGDVTFSNRYKKVNTNILGSGNITFDQCLCEEMQIDLTGSGSVLATGKSKSLSANLTGSGSLDTGNLIVETTNVIVRGSGNANISAQQTAVISLTGSGDVHVHGKPPHREVSRTGSGRVDFD
jgi:hypothetical protein